MNNYILVKSLSLPNNIVEQVKLIDRRTLTGSTSFGPKECRRMFYNRFQLTDYLAFEKLYGFWFDKICTTDYYVLPDELTNSITDAMSDFFKQDLTNEIVIRLQSMYGTQGTALHIDPTRTASLIYPIDHRARAETCFYQSVDQSVDPPDGMVNPNHYKYVNGVVIDRYPTLLNVKKVHAVMFDSNIIDKQTPRLSLTVKWKTHDFDQVAGTVC
jgi:hypothetical protein